MNLENYCPYVYIYQSTEFGELMSPGSKDVFKNGPCLMF